MKKGPPHSIVIIPTGTFKILAKASAQARNVAPIKAEAGIRNLLSSPTNPLAM
jgi:hypothetical protein